MLPYENIQQALEKFTTFKLEELPVLTSETNAKVLGYLSEAYALRRYTQELESRNAALSGAGTQ